MSPAEVLWRIQQKILQYREHKLYGPLTDVSAKPMSRHSNAVAGMPARPGVWLAAPAATGETAEQLHAADWHKGSVHGTTWPVEWAYSLQYKQRDDIGDARLAWEPNRHLNWPRLAVNFAATSNRSYLDELRSQLDDWTLSNPMLYGIAWVSVMEVAIRAIEWSFTANILANITGEDKEVRETVRRLAIGAENMALYVSQHRSRHSSANNHLLVELASMIVAGCLTGRDEWIDEATAELTEQIYRQFSDDGVNLEMSLHYHTFAMEAYMVSMVTLKATGRNVPRRWYQALRGWSSFVSGCMAEGVTPIEFGDSDRGMLLNFTGPDFNYYRYLLQEASILAGDPIEVFVPMHNTEPTVLALHGASTAARFANVVPRPHEPLEYFSTANPSGDTRTGFVVLRGGKPEVTVAIDAAPMGFGSIAAHAHADMLSFQLFDGTEPVLTDGGTYLYHCGAADRDMRRSELMHNTVWIPGHPQGEMRGPFLWGKRGCANVDRRSVTDQVAAADCSAVMADGSRMLWRSFSLNRTSGTLIVTDLHLTPECVTTFIAAPGTDVSLRDEHTARINQWILTTDSGTLTLEPMDVAPDYGHLRPTTALRLRGRNGRGTVTLTRAAD